MCSQSENPVLNGLDGMFLSCSKGKEELCVQRGRGLAALEVLGMVPKPPPLPAPLVPGGPIRTFPPGQGSGHFSCQGPDSKYVRAIWSESQLLNFAIIVGK